MSSEGPLWNIAMDEQSAWWKEHFPGPDFRYKQVRDWVFKKHVLDAQHMNNLPQDLRAELGRRSAAVLAPVERQVSSAGEADKFVFKCHDDSRLESVLLRSDKRRTVCLSTQVGCALACTFCHTGLMGFKRNLSVAEMVEQVLQVAAGEDQRISNIVVMGMGEPFLNYENLMTALRIINAPEGLGLGARNITISTSGIKGGILKLAAEPEQWGLAVSLHAANDALRTSLMPINKSLSLKNLMEEVQAYVGQTKRRVSFEYILLQGVNAGREQAAELAALLRGRLCHVNLIPYNPVPTLPFAPAARKAIQEFQDVVVEAGIPCTVRIEKGQDILAACGQLAHKTVHG